MVSLFGSGLASGTAHAASTSLPQTLAGASVALRDAAGTTSAASLYYVSPSQINLVVPGAASAGPATMTIASVGSAPVSFATTIASVAPGIFQLNANTALANANVVRVQGDQQSVEPVYQLDSAGNVIAHPIDLGPAGDSVYLSLLATGLQNARNPTATIGGLSAPVLYSGPQGSWTGVDQVNIGPLPRSLAGRGRVNIIVAADGRTANPVQVVVN